MYNNKNFEYRQDDPVDKPIRSHTDLQKDKIRVMVSSIYGIQKMRIQCGNRLVASFTGHGDKMRNRTPESVKAEKLEKQSQGDESTISKDSSDKDAAKTLKLIVGEYNRVADVIADMALSKTKSVRSNPSKARIEQAIKKVNADAVASKEGAKEGKLEFIKEVFDYRMADIYKQQLDTEERAVAALADEVRAHPMWDIFFKDVRGCGPMMAGVCLAYLDPYKARHASGFWRYAGLDVVTAEDGTTHGRSRSDTEEQQYIDENGDIKTKKGVTYNPKVKSKLIGVLGGSFIKFAEKDGIYVGYGKVYYDKKNYYNNKPETKDFSDYHKHRMALRFAVKMFLRDLWVAWRTYEGLEVSEPYEVAKLGAKPHGYNDAYSNKK